MTDRVTRALDDVRRRWVPDPRLGVFEVRRDGERLVGVTTSRDALAAARRVAADAGLEAVLVLLPDERAAAAPAAIVTAAAAPLHPEPRPDAPRSSEALHGERLTVLERRGDWLRVRARDGYHAWLHQGYAVTGSDPWADDWTSRARAWSLGAELRLEEGRLRLPLGAMVCLRRDGTVETADGRLAGVAAGVVRPALEAGAEARLIAPPAWALRWLGGAPYAWGGRSDWGLDCSGLVQTTFAVRGTILPRDTDLQFAVGNEVPLGADGAGYQPGDLLFFAEGGRVSHVALWAGGGRVVHAALARGGVGTDDLFGEGALVRRLRAGLVGVRRV